MNTDTTNALTPSAKSSPRNALYSPAPADTRTRGGRGGRPRSDAINLFTPSRGARYALTTADVQLTAVTLKTDRGHVDDRIRLPVTIVNSVSRKHGRGSGSQRASDQRIRLLINRSPSAGHHHRRRRRRRRTDTRQPMFVQACHCCSLAHLNRSRRLVIIDTVCARHIRTYESAARSPSLTEAGTHSSQRTRRNTARRCKVLRHARQ